MIPCFIVVYTTEFQKWSLPHAHICVFLDEADKLPTTYHIDKIISTEIPDQQTQLDLLNLVREFIFDGLCGLANKHSLCMKSVRCIIFFPKQNYDQTTTMDILCIDVVIMTNVSSKIVQTLIIDLLYLTTIIC